MVHAFAFQMLPESDEETNAIAKCRQGMQEQFDSSLSSGSQFGSFSDAGACLPRIKSPQHIARYGNLLNAVAIVNETHKPSIANALVASCSAAMLSACCIMGWHARSMDKGMSHCTWSVVMTIPNER